MYINKIYKQKIAVVAQGQKLANAMPIQGNEIFTLVNRQSAALSSAVQMSPEFSGMWGPGVSYWGRNVLTLGSEIPFAYPAMCGTQREIEVLFSFFNLAKRGVELHNQKHNVQNKSRKQRKECLSIRFFLSLLSRIKQVNLIKKLKQIKCETYSHTEGSVPISGLYANEKYIKVDKFKFADVCIYFVRSDTIISL